MHENVILAVKGYHSAVSYAYIAVIALGNDCTSTIGGKLSILIQIRTCYCLASCYCNLVVAVLAAAA